jgi:hypothetical protein
MARVLRQSQAVMVGLETKRFFENLNFDVDYRGPGE